MTDCPQNLRAARRYRLPPSAWLAASMLLAGCTEPGHAQQPVPAATPEVPEVQVVRPEAAPAEARLRLPARTAPIEQALIFARATGQIAERRVDIGDRVKAGDVLAVIAAPEIDREADRARAALAQNEAALQLADVSLQRSESLVEQNLLSRQLLDERRAQLAQARANAQAAAAELARLREIQSFQTVRAPFAGQIAERRIERGDRVTGDAAGDTGYLFRLVRLDELRVLIDLPQHAAMKLPAQGDAVLRFAETGGETFAARITRRSGFIDPALGTMRVELTLANADGRLPAGLVGEAELNLLGSTTTLRLPTNAVTVVQGKSTVGLVTADDRYQPIPVQTGRNLGTQLEILSGLPADARVVLNPNALLSPGATVRIASEKVPEKAPEKTN